MESLGIGHKWHKDLSCTEAKNLISECFLNGVKIVDDLYIMTIIKEESMPEDFEKVFQDNFLDILA
jgi:hypothetical protein